MLALRKDKNAWLKDALIDAGLRQKDVAKIWHCGPAVISRFIQTGEPRLTYDRLVSLAKLLGMGVEELHLRISSGIAPRGGAVARQAARRQLEAAGVSVQRTEEPATTLDTAIRELRESANKVQRLLPPGMRVTYKIEEGEQK
jgi:plasmid maintenance system antidote protein VapI